MSADTNADTSVLARFRSLIGSDSVETDAAARAFTVDGLAPQCVLFPATVDELARCAAAAHDTGWAVIPVGNGTQLAMGRVPRRYDVALSTRRLRRILAHEAGDMTATVEAGLTVAELNRALAAAGQRLPVDPPYPESTTIGALIASDAAGPLRLSQGKVRDLLIGITVVLADGTVIKGGGRVVKNVAGYDLMKLFTGSFGTLGIIVEATFKTRPCPEREAVFVVPAASTEAALTLALEVLNAPLAPLYVEALNLAAARRIAAGIDGPFVAVGCGGSAEEVEAQRDRLQALAGSRVGVLRDADGARLSAALRDFPANGSHSISGQSGPLVPGPPGEGLCGCKVSLLPSQLTELLVRIEDEAARRGFEVAALMHVGSGIAVIRAAGASAAFPAFAEWLRVSVRAAHGCVVFDVLPVSLKDQVDPWGGETPAPALVRGIKQTLDPHGRFSPGRFVGGI